MAERKVWAQEEDKILKMLVQDRKIKKWSQISKILSNEFGISHRNGKQCRQRYLNHLASDLKKGEWTSQEQSNLIRLHNRYGNRWAQIARHFIGRTDNCVKNQLYLKLRKSLRFINQSIQTQLKRKFKLLKINFIYKLIEMADQKYKSTPAIKKEASQESYQLKNKILKLQCVEGKQQEIISLICLINQFNKKYKKRLPKKKSKHLCSSDSEKEDFDEVISEEICQNKMDLLQEVQLQAEISIKVSAPQVPLVEYQIFNKQNQNFDYLFMQQQKGCFKSRLLKKGSNQSNAQKNIGILHSLSIQKQSAFQTIVNLTPFDPKLQEQIISRHLFSRVDPSVHGQQNQNRIKAKRSSSGEDFPHIIVELEEFGDKKNTELRASRLRSFGSIEASYEFQNDFLSKPSSFQKNFMNKQDVDNWLSNIQ